MNIVNPTSGIFMLLLYMGAVFALAAVYCRNVNRKVSFHAADRKVSEWRVAFSIASTWIWAPALFISAQKAYTEGWVGLFWFTVPNVLCLILFAYFAEILRRRLPEGYTISGYIRERYSKRAQSAYIFQSLGLLICCLSVQMLAGGKVVSQVTGISYPVVTLLIGAIAISYSWVYGLKASVITDYFKMILIFILIAVLVPWAVWSAGGVSTVWAGIGGRSGEYLFLFSGKGGSVFWSFGLSAFIGLMSGPFGDQAFYQRAYAVEEGRVKGAFWKGAFIFALVPLFMSLLGFIAAGAHVDTKTPGMINLQSLVHFLPAWTAIPFAFLVMSALVSAMDSHLTALASVSGHDILNRTEQGENWSSRRASVNATDDDTAPDEDKASIRYGRIMMAVTTVCAYAIAQIPGMQVLYLFLFYGTLRASTMLPTIITLVVRDNRIHEAGIFYGVITSIVVGLPIFAYGNFTKNTVFIVIGSVLTLLLSAIVTVVVSAAAGTLGAALTGADTDVEVASNE